MDTTSGKDTVMAEDTLASMDSANAPLFIFPTEDTVNVQEFTDTLVVLDINNDGYPDRSVVRGSGGSGFSSFSVIITDGKTRKKMEWHKDWCKCEILISVPVPPVFAKPENLAFRQHAERRLFGKIISRITDPGMNWLIDSRMNEKEVANTQWIERMITPGMQWNPLPVSISHDFISSPISGPRASEVYRTTMEAPEWFGGSDAELILDYGSYHHIINIFSLGIDTPKVVLTLDNVNYYKTHQGLLGIRGRQWAWFYIADAGLSDVMDKISSSIDTVFSAGGLIFVQQYYATGNQKHVVSIDPSTGKVAFISQDRFGSEPGKFWLESGDIVCFEDDWWNRRVQKMPLHELKKEMELGEFQKSRR